MGDLSQDRFFIYIELNFNLHVGDINVSVAFMCARINMIGMDFWKLGPGDMGR
ncbi:MAG: hypothetical protein RIQ91_586 [Bacteroidota bacterium]